MNCKNCLIKMTTSKDCSFRARWANKLKKQYSTPSQSIKLQRASRNTCLLYPTYTSSYASICWQLSSSELDNSLWTDSNGVKEYMFGYTDDETV